MKAELARLKAQQGGMAPSPSSDLKAGDLTTVTLPGGVEMRFCWCPPGSFTMGSPDSETGHDDDEKQARVTLTGFWMAETECTQAQWQAVMSSNPSKFKGQQLPVETVSWEDVGAWVTKAGSSARVPSGWRLALPTEAQWEYACRAGTTTAFSFGDKLNGKEANCDGTVPYGTTAKGTYLQKTCEVRSYRANAWGLHEMHGNVWEWCADWYGETLAGGTDPAGPTTGVLRVLRGGSCGGDAAGCRAAHRGGLVPGFRNCDLGFRPALVPSR
jgi:formylglycine-generating enzyme required for sulfatase activity